MQFLADLRNALSPFVDFIESTPGHIVISIILPLMAMAVTWVMRRRFRVATDKASDEEIGRISVDYRRNTALIYLFTGLFILGLWSSRITGMLISLAALGGAVLIVSKEPILNIWGRLIFSLNSEVELGDHIEIGEYSGKLLKTTLFNMHLAQLRAGKQTGRVITLPNHVLITQPMVNLNSLGKFCVHIFDVKVSTSMRVAEAGELLLSLANDACRDRNTVAKKEFELIKKTKFMHLPRVEPEIIWSSTAKDEVTLTLRYVCPTLSRGQTEQKILSMFIKQFYAQPNTESSS